MDGWQAANSPARNFAASIDSITTDYFGLCSLSHDQNATKYKNKTKIQPCIIITPELES